LPLEIKNIQQVQISSADTINQHSKQLDKVKQVPMIISRKEKFKQEKKRCLKKKTNLE